MVVIDCKANVASCLALHGHAFLRLKIAVPFDTINTYSLAVPPVSQNTNKLRHRRRCAASVSIISGYFKKGEGKFVALYVMKAFEGNGVREALILNAGVRKKSVGAT